MKMSSLSKSDLEYCVRNYLAFREKEGSEQIASCYSQINLAKLLITFRPEVIYEHGGGIGTLTKLIKHFLPKTSLVVYEQNQYCSSKIFNLNLSDVTVVDKLPRKTFDGIVIDDAITLIELFHLLRRQPRLKFVFIEGKRRSTVRALALIILLLRKRFIFIEENPGEALDELKGSSVLDLIKGHGKKGLFHPKLKAGSCFIQTENWTYREFLKYFLSLLRVEVFLKWPTKGKVYLKNLLN